jgi:hypothetical protein
VTRGLLRTLAAVPPYVLAFYLLAASGALESPTAEWISVGSFVTLNLVTGLLVREWLAALIPLTLLAFAVGSWSEGMFDTSDVTVGGFMAALSLTGGMLVGLGVLIRRAREAARS